MNNLIYYVYLSTKERSKLFSNLEKLYSYVFIGIEFLYPAVYGPWELFDLGSFLQPQTDL